jgi:hypothetical protein
MPHTEPWRLHWQRSDLQQQQQQQQQQQGVTSRTIQVMV